VKPNGTADKALNGSRWCGVLPQFYDFAVSNANKYQMIKYLIKKPGEGLHGDCRIKTEFIGRL
jgi:hypothetical protein